MVFFFLIQGGSTDKRGRKLKFGSADDYMDKSAGYDLSDPFIDDGEAVGFYLNWYKILTAKNATRNK